MPEETKKEKAPSKKNGRSEESIWERNEKWKEKREAAINRKAKALEKEQAHDSPFRPSISTLAQKMSPEDVAQYQKLAVERKQKNIEKVAAEKESEFSAQCLFRPKVNNWSQQRISKGPFFYEHSLEWEAKRKARIEELRQEAEGKEEEEKKKLEKEKACMMDPKSEQLVANRSGEESIFLRWKKALELKEEHVKKLKESTTPSFTPQTSQYRNTKRASEPMMESPFERMYYDAAAKSERERKDVTSNSTCSTSNSIVRSPEEIAQHLKEMETRYAESNKRTLVERDKERRALEFMFHPQLSERTAQHYANYQKRKEKQRQGQEEVPSKEPEPAAEVQQSQVQSPSHTSSKLPHQSNPQVFFERNQRLLDIRNHHAKELADQLKEVELQECTFAPILSPSTEKVLKDKKRSYLDPTELCELRKQQQQAQSAGMDNSEVKEERNISTVQQQQTPSKQRERKSPSSSSSKKGHTTTPHSTKKEQGQEGNLPVMTFAAISSSAGSGTVDEKINEISDVLKEWKALEASLSPSRGA